MQNEWYCHVLDVVFASTEVFQHEFFVNENPQQKQKKPTLYNEYMKKVNELFIMFQV